MRLEARENDVENTLGRMCDQRESFKENKNEKDAYTYNRNEPKFLEHIMRKDNN